MGAISFDDFNVIEAHNQFRQLPIPKFYISQIDFILKIMYFAEEVDKNLFPELKKDYFFNEHFLTKCYVIHDEETLKKLFNNEEKEQHAEFIKKNGFIKKQIDYSNINDRVHAVGQGSLLFIIFQSEDGKHLRPFISIHGPCEYMANLLTVFQGIDPSKRVLGDMDYKLYLFTLAKLGYIKV
jgi:hypothetical protein